MLHVSCHNCQFDDIAHRDNYTVNKSSASQIALLHPDYDQNIYCIVA